MGEQARPIRANNLISPSSPQKSTASSTLHTTLLPAQPTFFNIVQPYSLSPLPLPLHLHRNHDSHLRLWPPTFTLSDKPSVTPPWLHSSDISLPSLVQENLCDSAPCSQLSHTTPVFLSRLLQLLSCAAGSSPWFSQSHLGPPVPATPLSEAIGPVRVVPRPLEPYRHYFNGPIKRCVGGSCCFFSSTLPLLVFSSTASGPCFLSWSWMVPTMSSPAPNSRLPSPR